MLKISVIVPVYNVEKYLEKCVSSIIQQDFTSYEIVIIDDGSTDRSGDIADSLAQEHLELIKVIHQDNLGSGGARNTGINNAKGEYFMFVDSDDSIAPNALKDIYNCVSNSQATMAVFDYANVNDDGKILSVINGNRIYNANQSLSCRPEILFIPNSGCNKIYHRSLFIDTGIRFPEKLWFEDFSTIVKIYPHAGRIAYLRETLYFYLQRSGSIMHNKKVDRNIEIITAMEDIIEYYKQEGIYCQFKEEINYLIILHVYILASARVVKIDPNSKLIASFNEYTKRKVPDYKSNKYLSELTRSQKHIFALLEKKKYLLLNKLFRFKEYFNRKVA